jgi:hypothetical protein
MESDLVSQMGQYKTISMTVFGIPFNAEIELCKHWLLPNPQG